MLTKIRTKLNKK